jgi:hypothetical protein
MTHTAKPTPAWLLAQGGRSPPVVICVAGESYSYVRMFKQDFFALTALYEGAAGKLVLKMGRTHPLMGLPMAWLGRVLSNHESRLYRLAHGIEGIPRILGAHGPTAFVHEYVEGRPLPRNERPGDEFFPRLSALLTALHRRSIAYVDLEKPENILLGDDGRPHLIDFQISWHIPVNRLGDTWPARLILRTLQASDRYHLAKHWRKLRPDQFAASDLAGSFVVPFWIRWHRAVFRPLTLLRRQILVWMGLRSSIRVRSPG